MTSRIWLAMPALAAMSACDFRSPPEGARTAIVGADPALPASDLRFQSAAGVQILTADGNAVFCSAVLVAENLALTAAHCLRGARDVTALFFGPNLLGNAAAARVTAWQQHPQYAHGTLPASADFDIAWVRLDGPLPPGVRPALIEADHDRLRPGETATLVGYGKTSEWEMHGDFERRNVDLPVLEILAHQKRLGKYNYDNLITLGVTPNRGACDGDSGGPLYVRHGNTVRVAGITHGVDVFPDIPIAADDDVDICAAGKVAYVAVGPHLTWIENSSGILLPAVEEAPDALTLPEQCPAGSSKTIESGGYCLNPERGVLVGPFARSFVKRCKSIASSSEECAGAEIPWSTARKVLNPHPFLTDTPPADHLSPEDREQYEMRMRGFSHPGAVRLTERARGRVMVSYEDVDDPSSAKFCVSFATNGMCRMRISPDYGGGEMPEGACRFSAQDDGWIYLACRTLTGQACNSRAPGAVESLVGHITGVKVGLATFTGEETRLVNQWGQGAVFQEGCPF